MATDLAIIRPLAQRYSELSRLDVQQERLTRYRKTVALERDRPVVLIHEVPWGEIRDDALTLQCDDPDFRSIEYDLRIALYQWDHFQVDMVLPPVYRVSKRIENSGIGVEVLDKQIQGDTGAYIAAHEYVDQLRTEEDIEKLTLPTITYNQEATERTADIATQVFDGLMSVEIVGTTFQYNIWDRIATYRGVDALLLDLAMRPDFMHKIARRFMEIGQVEVAQYLEQGLLDTDPLLLHCTIAATDELPANDFDGTVRLKDVWGRCAAQIFAAVSPEMHDEFDLAYNQELFGECGLLYYGCCEPMDTKIDILRKRFDNLRKISITPWADPGRAAEQIGVDYVLAAKPNPAFVNSSTFDPNPVADEITRYLEACEENGTPCEFVLKDISTIANRPENLSQWAQTVGKVIDSFY